MSNDIFEKIKSHTIESIDNIKEFSEIVEEVIKYDVPAFLIKQVQNTLEIMENNSKQLNETLEKLQEKFMK